MLCTLDDYCTEHQIQYFLVAGTLLGAVRHSDFIPWDDDIDIGMIRSEYEKFVQTFAKFPIPGYFLQHHTTESNYLLTYAKLRKLNTTFHEYENDYQPKIHNGIFIDIFPFDPTCKNPLLEHTKLQLLKLIATITELKRWHPRKNALKNIAAKIVRRCIFFIKPRALSRIVDRLLTQPQDDTPAYCCYHLFSLKQSKKAAILCSEFENNIKLPFKDRAFPSPGDHHAVLTRCYGNYMALPPVEQRYPQHALKFNIDK